MNATTPRLRAHLLAELRDLDDKRATTDQLAGQVPDPYERRNDGDHYGSAWGQYVYPHLLAMEKQGLVRKIKPEDSRCVFWQLIAS